MRDRAKKNIYQTIALIGCIYDDWFLSCWMVIPIRANANPPMNLNDPDTAIVCLINIIENNMVIGQQFTVKTTRRF